MYRATKQTGLKQRKGAGMLLEIIFVTWLIAAVGVAMYGALIYSDTIAQRTQNSVRASRIAAQEIEIIRKTPMSGMYTVPYNGAFIGNTLAPVSELPSGSRNLSITWYNSPTNTIRKVVVTVTWLEKKKTRSVIYTTLIYDKGLSS